SAAAADQLRRLGTGIMDVEVAAWAARNLFELDLLVRWVLKSDRNLEVWQTQLATDEMTIIEGVLGLSVGTNPHAVQVLESRMGQIRSLLAKHNVAEAKPKDIRSLAEQVGCGREYAAFFKLYSKYVHPSSWLLNASPDQRNGWVDAFLIQGQLY